MAENGEITDEPGLQYLHMTSAQAGDVWKWVWGDKCILKLLSEQEQHDMLLRIIACIRARAIQRGDTVTVLNLGADDEATVQE